MAPRIMVAVRGQDTARMLSPLNRAARRSREPRVGVGAGMVGVARTPGRREATVGRGTPLVAGAVAEPRRDIIRVPGVAGEPQRKADKVVAGAEGRTRAPCPAVMVVSAVSVAAVAAVAAVRCRVARRRVGMVGMVATGTPS